MPKIWLVHQVSYYKWVFFLKYLTTCIMNLVYGPVFPAHIKISLGTQKNSPKLISILFCLVTSRARHYYVIPICVGWRIWFWLLFLFQLPRLLPTVVWMLTANVNRRRGKDKLQLQAASESLKITKRKKKEMEPMIVWWTTFVF